MAGRRLTGPPAQGQPAIPEERAQLETLRNLMLDASGGRHVPLAQIATLSYALEPPLIWRRRTRSGEHRPQAARLLSRTPPLPRALPEPAQPRHAALAKSSLKPCASASVRIAFSASAAGSSVKGGRTFAQPGSPR